MRVYFVETYTTVEKHALFKQPVLLLVVKVPVSQIDFPLVIHT